MRVDASAMLFNTEEIQSFLLLVYNTAKCSIPCKNNNQVTTLNTEYTVKIRATTTSQTVSDFVEKEEICKEPEFGCNRANVLQP